MNYGQMHWSNIFFVHWRVSSAQLLPHIPPGLQIDLFEGDAYVSLVALHVTGPAPWPLMPLSRILLDYNQLNVRTYVTGGPGPGIVLLDTLVDRYLPSLGARLLGMPYRFARDLDLKVHDGHVLLHAFGQDIEGEVDDVAPASVPGGSLDSFLVDRFWVYAYMSGGMTYGVRIEHAPWRLRPVHLARQLSPSAAGIDGIAEPVRAHLAEKLDISIVETASVRWPIGV